MNQYRHFATEEADIIRSQVSVDPSEWKLLRRLRLPDRFNDPQGGTIKRALVIDVETTGLSTCRRGYESYNLLKGQWADISRFGGLQSSEWRRKGGSIPTRARCGRDVPSRAGAPRQ
jgi:hypothetical protein